MGGGSNAKDHPMAYFSASALAAAINYPLWRASAIGQSGFRMTSMVIGGQTIPSSVTAWLHAFAPPYKGMVPTVFGMTWARAAIFWGSDYGRHVMRQHGYSDSTATVVPPLLVSTFVQYVNMPIVRATVTLQDPKCAAPNVFVSLRDIYRSHGVPGLWHGTTAGVAKTVPKYCIAVIIKDFMEDWLQRPDPTSPTYDSDLLWRSAYKSSAAGLAGAALTNPLDVIRNEMFKTNLGMTQTIRNLHAEMGYAYFTRGLGKNLIAVAMPVACTIFLTDAFVELASKND